MPEDKSNLRVAVDLDPTSRYGYYPKDMMPEVGDVVLLKSMATDTFNTAMVCAVTPNTKYPELAQVWVMRPHLTVRAYETPDRPYVAQVAVQYETFSIHLQDFWTRRGVLVAVTGHTGIIDNRNLALR